MASKPVLYSYFRSSCSWRVRIALAIKGIEYDYKAINLLKGEQLSEDFLTVNPMGQLPTLLIDGETLTQSMPIIEYLEDTRPGANLLPKDPIARVQARRLAEVINAGIQPIQNLGVLKKVAEYSNNDTDKAKWGHYWIDRGFEALEIMLSKTAGKYSVGDEVSIADITLVPQVYNANRFKVDMTKFPTISRINVALLELEPFKKADPSNQPDCPDELKKGPI